jgi:RNA polymerase sigma-70 factor (ECF subfamily)
MTEAFDLHLFAFALRSTAPADPDLDAALIQRANGGDRRAYDELYRRHVDIVYRRISRLVGPDPDREDLVQQVFIGVFGSLRSFRGEAAFGTWLYRVIANVAFDHLRRRRRQHEVPSAEDLGLLVAERSPELAAHEREQIGRVLACLERIKPKKRIAFVLRVVEGLSIEEIAQIVGARPPAVGQRIKYAQRELNAMLARADLRGRS